MSCPDHTNRDGLQRLGGSKGLPWRIWVWVLTAYKDSCLADARRVVDMLKYLRSAYPDAQVLPMALLPRGPLSVNGTYVVQPSGFTPAVQLFNAALLAYSHGDSSVHYVDCGPALLLGGQVRPTVQCFACATRMRHFQAVAGPELQHVYRLCDVCPGLDI